MADARQKTAINGFLDLSAHDFSKYAIVDLSGTWLLYPDELLNPESLATRTNGQAPIPINIPGLWKDQDFNGKKGPIFGKGTYVLKIKLPTSYPALTFRLERFQCSSLLYINDKLYSGPLVIDPQNEKNVALTSSEYYQIPENNSEVTIILQGSNYWDSFGIGLLVVPKLGLTNNISNIRSINLGYESFISGILFLAFLYHFMLFFIQRKNYALLVFSLLMLDMMFYQFSSSEQFWFSQAGLSRFATVRINNISSYAGCVLFTLYFRFLYPELEIKPAVKILVAIGCLLICVASFFPARIFTSCILYLNIFLTLTLAYALYIVLMAIYKRTEQASVMLFGIIILMIPVASDVIRTSNNLSDFYLTPLALIPFIMAQSYLLAKRYTRDTTEAEKLRMSTARLTELDHIKTNFLANISHELRTPLTLIKAPVEAIATGEYGERISKDDQVFALISNNVNRLLRLVENLLSMTRLESGKRYELKSTDLVLLVPIYIDEFKMVAKNAGLTLDMVNKSERPLVADLEIKAFEIIFFNLMSNAIKFTKPGGKVTVRLSRRADGKKTFAQIEIIDTGIGIRGEDLPNLFVRYGKIYDKERQHYEGNGIGLSLARETARAMGGDISVQSAFGEGSAFCVEFPLSEKDAIPFDTNVTYKSKTPQIPRDMTENQKTTAPSSKNFSRILVVEDHEEMRHFIASALATEHEIIEAGDGQEALNILAAIPPPDLIISDIMMPHLDGIGLFESTRANGAFAPIPFMFLTARNESDEKIQLLRAGSIEYMVKPFSIEELRAKVSAIISLRNNERFRLLERVQSAINGDFSVGAGTGSGSGKQNAAALPTEPVYPPDLTVREIEILKKVAEGATDKEIAEHYGIAIRTASNHVGAILKKTGVSSRQSLIIRFGK